MMRGFEPKEARNLGEAKLRKGEGRELQSNVLLKVKTVIV